VIGEHTEEEASLYVLGLLPPEEKRRFEAAMEANAELAELVGHLETGAAALAWTAPPRVPPPALRERIKASIAAGVTQQRTVVVPFRGIKTWIPWAIAACIAIWAGGIAFNRYHLQLLTNALLIREHNQQVEIDGISTIRNGLQDRLNATLARAISEGKLNAELQTQLDTVRGQVADLQARNALSEVKLATLASIMKDNPQAVAVVAWDLTSQRGILKTVNMPAAQPDKDYQLWIIAPDYKEPVSAGVFDPTKGANFAPVRPISKADKFAISLEKKGGSSEPQGPIVLVGE